MVMNFAHAGPMGLIGYCSAVQPCYSEASPVDSKAATTIYWMWLAYCGLRK